MENVGNMFEETSQKDETETNCNSFPQFSLTGASFEEKPPYHYNYHHQGFMEFVAKESPLLSCAHQLGCDVGERIVHGVEDEGFYHPQFQSSSQKSCCNMIMPSFSPPEDLMTLVYQSNLSLSFAADSATSGSGYCGPAVFHLNSPLQPPHLYPMLHDQDSPSLSGTLLDEGDRGAAEGTASHHDEVKEVAKGGKKPFKSERERRIHFNYRYDALRSLIPNPSKNDKASILGDAIEYIKELGRTVKRLELLLEKKRCERSKRRRTETDLDQLPGDQDHCYNSLLRSSSFQRKSKDTEVGIRIIGDEATVKLVNRKFRNCFTVVSKALEELQLDIQDISGGHVGDYCSMWLTTKIYEGSSVYANAVADRLIQVLDGQDQISCQSSSC